VDEHQVGHSGDRRQLEHRVRHRARRGRPPLNAAPGEEGSAHEQRAHAVADPVDPPREVGRSARDHASQHQAGDADGGRHQWSEDGAKDRQRRDILDAVHARVEAGAAQREGADQRLEGVAGGQTAGHQRRQTATEVGEESAHPHRRPEPPSEQDQRRQRDSRRWPDGCDVGVPELEQQTQAGGGVVGGHQKSSLQQRRACHCPGRAPHRSRRPPSRGLRHGDRSGRTVQEGHQAILSCDATTVHPVVSRSRGEFQRTVTALENAAASSSPSLCR